MELREEIARVIAEHFDDHLACVPAGHAADAILAIPRIRDLRDELRQAADSLEDLGHPDVAAHYRSKLK